MAGVLATILGTGNVVEKGIDLLDSFHTSSVEEKEATTAAKIRLLQAYAPFKLAQRVLAFSFTGVYLFCFLLSLAAIGHAYFTGELAVVIEQGGKTVLDLPLIVAIRELMAAYKMDWIEGTIVLFYFGGGLVEGYQEKKKDREERSEKAVNRGPR